MRKERLMLYVPISALIILILVLYSPEIFSTHIPVLSEVKFEQKTDLILTFSIAVFAAMEGYATYQRWSMEHNRHKVEDARNELQRAYGPLYTLLNKRVPANHEKNSFWLDFDERKRIDEIMATYPFMFPAQIHDLWQQKIRSPVSFVQEPSEPTGIGIDLSSYLELRDMINKEYTSRVKAYRELLKD
jgi:hypothetical protein